jgi:hypothetical protein
MLHVLAVFAFLYIWNTLTRKNKIVSKIKVAENIFLRNNEVYIKLQKQSYMQESKYLFKTWKYERQHSK